MADAVSPEPYFDLSVEDFGPIARGRVRFRPLTLLIGPNNTGKSYLAMLARALMAQPPAASRVPPPGLARALEGASTAWAKVVEQASGPEQEEEVFVPPALVAAARKAYLSADYLPWLSGELPRLFGTPLSGLIRSGQSRFRVHIRSGSGGVGVHSVGGRLAGTLRGPSPPGCLESVQDWPAVLSDDFVDGCLVVRNFGAVSPVRSRDEDPLDALRGHLYRLGAASMPGIACLYLPAARSGLLQVHREISESVLRSAAGVRPARDASDHADEAQVLYSGIVGDFLATVHKRRLPSPVWGPDIARIADDLATAVTSGAVDLREEGPGGSRNVVYRSHAGEMALHRTSSTVAEVAPLVLYLKYHVSPDTVLIIEEPEAHLHPENQRRLAKYLVRLVRAGVRLVLTTHSDVLVSQLDNFIPMSQLAAKDRKKRDDYGPDDYLRPEEVGAYVFEWQDDGGPEAGSVIRELKVTLEDGIPQDEFMRVLDPMHTERVKLERDLMRQGDHG